MKIKRVPIFIGGCINILLAFVLLTLIVYHIRPVKLLPIPICLVLCGICQIMDSIETEKQRRRRKEELQEMAKLYGWDKE